MLSCAFVKSLLCWCILTASDNAFFNYYFILQILWPACSYCWNRRKRNWHNEALLRQVQNEHHLKRGRVAIYPLSLKPNMKKKEKGKLSRRAMRGKLFKEALITIRVSLLSLVSCGALSYMFNRLSTLSVALFAFFLKYVLFCNSEFQTTTW